MSRFVSAGTDEDPSERDEAWLKAQEVLEAKREAKSEVGKQEGGKTLYETLQANKAAKQEAFEESIRLKNQFRSLDEDEVEFLDSVLESTRAKEAEVRRQTSQQLSAFRQQQEEAEQAANQEDALEVLETGTWKAGPRKRKKGRESVIGGIKLRRTSTIEKESEGASQTREDSDEAASSVLEKSSKVEDSGTPPSEQSIPPKTQHTPEAAPKPPSPTNTALGLAAYSSDEDDG